MLMQDSLTGYLHEVPEFGEAEPYGEMAYDGFGNPVGFFGRRRRRRRVSEPGPQAVPPAPEMGPEGGEQMPGSEEMGEVVYDGFGNPVGFSFKKLIRKGLSVAKRFAPLASLLPIPGAGLLPQAIQAAQRLVPVAARFSPAAQILRRALPAGVVQQFAPVAQAFQQAPREDIGGFYGEAVPIARGPLMRPPPPGWIRRPVPYQGKRGRRVYLRCVAWPGPRGLVPVSAAQAPAVAAAAPGAAAAIVQPAPPRRWPRRIIRRRR